MRDGVFEITPVRRMLAQAGAFCRIDRGDALLISDYPRCARAPESLTQRLWRAGWRTICEDRLARLWPLVPGADPEFLALLIRHDKFLRARTDPAAHERGMRQALACALRRHEAAKAAQITFLLKEVMNEDGTEMERTQLLFPLF